MGLSVSSWFIDQLSVRNNNLLRKFTIGGSDYSDLVLQWPRFKYKWDAVQPISLNMQCAAESGHLDFFRTDKTTLRSQCQVSFGFTHPTSGDEFALLYEGTSDKVRFNRGACSINLLDKMKAFGERIVGNADSHATWTNSSLVSDIAWDICTSYGGLSDVRSTSNPDISYDAWLAWAAVWSADAVYMNADFAGTKVNEALRKIARMTRSAVYNDFTLIEFTRFSDASSKELLLTEDTYLDTDLFIDDATIINDQWLLGAYDVNSKDWGVAAQAVSSSSVGSYGQRVDVQKDENIWFVDSANTVNQAQRLIQFTKDPADQMRIQTTLYGLQRSLGETVRVNDTLLGVSSDSGFRLLAVDIDLDKCLVQMDVDNGMLLMPFILDDAKYGLLDQSYNVLL